MNYLKEYNITEEQIEEIDNYFTKTYGSSDVFKYEVEKVKSILDMFRKLNINNIYDVIMSGSDMFFDTAQSVKRRLDKYPNQEELSKLINADANNLKLVDLI